MAREPWFDERGVLRWTWLRTAAALGISALLALAAYMAAGREPLSLNLAAAAAVAAIVGISGRLVTVRRERWSGRDLQDVSVSSPLARGGRGVVRRVDVAARVMLALMLPAVAAAWFGPPADGSGDRYYAVVFTGSLAVGIYVFGLTSKLVVTPTQVVVCTPFTARRVPRSRLRGCDLRSDGDLALLVEGSPPVTVGTGTGPWWMEYANRRPAQLRAAKRLQALLDVIPAEPGDGPLTARRRYPVIALAALAAVAAVGSAAAVLR